MPAGKPAQADDASRTAAAERGRFGHGNRRSVVGGRAHKGKPRMVERVALTPPAEGLPTRRYHVAARALVRAASARIAASVGGGTLDPHVGYLVTAAGRAAKAMAALGVKALTEPELIAAAKADLKKRTARTPYVNPLPASVSPPLDMSLS